MIGNNLKEANNNLARSTERLSSGLRINSAADDAAGLAIAQRLKTDAGLADVAMRSINDGISIVSIAQSAVEEQSNILTSLQEIATAVESGSLSSAQQSAYQDEYRALVKEFGRIGDTAQFPNSTGDISLLMAGRGSNPSTVNIQAGITGSSSSQITIALGDTAEYSGVINRNDLAATGSVTAADAKMTDIASMWQNQLMSFVVTDSGGTERTITAGISVNSNTVTFTFFIDNTDSATPPADGVSLDYRSQATATYNTTTGAFDSSSFSTTISGFTGGATALVSMDLRGLKMSSTTATSAPNLGSTSAIEMSGVETSGRATAALTIIDTRQASLDAVKASFNASNSRLEAAVTYMSVERENYSAAYDRITSVDVAEEVANMTASLIRQQGALASFASANQQPEMALTLLEGLTNYQTSKKAA